MTPCLNFLRQKSRHSHKETFGHKIILVNLFTRPFTFDLHPKHFTHYWNSYIDHYTTRIIGGHGCNIGIKLEEEHLKLSEDLNQI